MRALKADIEEKYLQKIVSQVEQQNKEYFEDKARELLRVQDKDLFAKSSANLLFLQSPNISRDEIEKQVKREMAAEANQNRKRDSRLMASEPRQVGPKSIDVFSISDSSKKDSPSKADHINRN